MVPFRTHGVVTALCMYVLHTADDASSTPLLPIDAAVRLGGDAEATPTIATGPVATSLPTGIVEALEHASTGPESESPSITRDDAA